MNINTIMITVIATLYIRNYILGIIVCHWKINYHDFHHYEKWQLLPSNETFHYNDIPVSVQDGSIAIVSCDPTVGQEDNPCVDIEWSMWGSTPVYRPARPGDYKTDQLHQRSTARSSRSRPVLIWNRSDASQYLSRACRCHIQHCNDSRPVLQLWSRKLATVQFRWIFVSSMSR